MKLACADFTFPLLPHENALKLISLLGFQGVDIGLFEGRGHLWPGREFARGASTAGSDLKKRLDDLGLQCADVFLQCDPDFRPYAINHPEPTRRGRAREWIVQAIDYALAAGSQHVSILPGVEWDAEPLESSLDRAATELAWATLRARAAGVTLGVEAHTGSLAPTPDSARQLVERVPGLTLTLDYTHFTRDGYSDDQIEPLLASASHFHARGARRHRLQCPVKDSTIDYQRVVERMKVLGYPGWVGVEYVWIDWEHCNECDNVSETVLLRDLIQAAWLR